jgi:hypothetical protein
MPARLSTRLGPRLAVEPLEERMLLNNRFVVPAGMVDNMSKFATLHDALTKPGLNAGDIIQIEPNSSPGQLFGNDVPAVKNLTIQGVPAFDVQSIPFFSVVDSVMIGSAEQGFTLKNVQVDIQFGDIEFHADGAITGCRFKNDSVGTPIFLVGTSAAVISNCYFENANPNDQGFDLLYLLPAPGSHNRITDNQFVALKGSNITLLNYVGIGSTCADLVAHNSFIDNTGNSAELFVGPSALGLTIQSNAFTDNDPSGTAILIYPTALNVQIVDNVISVPNSSFFGSARGIAVVSGSMLASTGMVVSANHISTGGNGTGIEIAGENIGFTSAVNIEGNDLHGNRIGVEIDAGNGGLVAGIDLGGGAQGSLGANNFRGDPTAIYVTASTAAGPIEAKGNIFGVADPSTVIHDYNSDHALAVVVSINQLTGNPAFVETLYLDFLHRAGNLSDPKDAAIWVMRLGQGMSATTVANLVARSPEGLGVAVDGLYHRFLGRDADPVGRANFVAYLQNGGTLEGASQILLASPEYQARFPTDSSFVQSLYQNLLHRTGSTAEVNTWVAQLPQLGQAGVAHALLLSQEYRADEVRDDYSWFLHRTGSTADINSWVNSGKDILTIDILFADSQEFQING